MPTDSHGIVSCEVFFKVSAERSQASVVTAKLFRKFWQEELAAKERMKAEVINIYASIYAVLRERFCRLFAIFY